MREQLDFLKYHQVPWNGLNAILSHHILIEMQNALANKSPVQPYPQIINA